MHPSFRARCFSISRWRVTHEPPKCVPRRLAAGYPNGMPPKPTYLLAACINVLMSLTLSETRLSWIHFRRSLYMPISILLDVVMRYTQVDRSR